MGRSWEVVKRLEMVLSAAIRLRRRATSTASGGGPSPSSPAFRTDDAFRRFTKASGSSISPTTVRLGSTDELHLPTDASSPASPLQIPRWMVLFGSLKCGAFTHSVTMHLSS